MAMNASKQLFLLRHAKSSWDDPSPADHERPLALRGRRRAALMVDHLRAQKITILLVLCPSAQRAVQTLELVAPTGEVRIEDQLYGASAGQLIARLRQVPDEHASVMLIGHNPAIQELAVILAREPGGLGEHKFPTGALATLALPGSWSELGPGGADLTAFVRPKDLSR